MEAPPLTTNSLAILKKRYLEGESVDSMWDRVSNGNPRYRELMSSLRFLPNSPTLFNLGRNNGCTLSACFVFDIGDYMLYHNGKIMEDSIVRTREKAISVAKAGGGVGYYLGNIRPRNSLIKSVHRVACGPVNVLRDMHAISRLTTQGGKRELAQMGVLNCDHQDIEEFVHCKDEDPQGLGSFNISVGWKNEWVEKALAGFNASQAELSREARLWGEQCKSAWKTGCPGMLFPDIVNAANINLHLGYLNGTNPCAETPNRTDEPCNLGSLSLPRYFVKGNRSFDWTQFADDVWTATEFLDDILTWNTFPHHAITEAAILTRKLGLGVMGWADLLGMMHIAYDSLEALLLADRIMETMANVSHACSEEMADKKGPYKGYSDRTNGPCRRNETNTSIAPTGTIAMIAGVWGSAEPHFALRCERTTAEGMKLEDGVQDWIWKQMDGYVPKIASEISPEWHIRHQAAFQKHTDLGVSKTINMPNSATVQDVSNAYKLLYELGCKGGTIFRDGCRSEQVLVKEKTKSVYLVETTVSAVSETQDMNGLASSPVLPPHSPPLNGPVFHIPSGSVPVPSLSSLTPAKSRHRLPTDRQSLTHKFRIDNTEGYLTVGLYEDGTPGELFLRVSKAGSTISGLLDAWAIAFSVALQYGAPLFRMVDCHTGMRFDPAGRTANDAIPLCTSVVDYVCRWLYMKYVEPASRIAGDTGCDKGIIVRSGLLCAECGAEAIYSGGCLTCTASGCGWSRCG